MNTTLDVIISKLEEAKRAATLENASFGFPDDKIEIIHTSRVFGGEVGLAGDELHPTEYVRRITRLHHNSWIIAPINSAIELLKVHAETLRESEKLIEALEKLDVPGIIQRAKANKIS